MDKRGSGGVPASVKQETPITEADERLREYQNNPDVPAEAKAMAVLLRSSGVTDYDPKIINQLLDFMHRMFTLDSPPTSIDVKAKKRPGSV